MPSEFDEFASLWRQEPTAEERRAFAEMAERSRRRALLVDRAELGLAGLLVLAILGVLVLSPEPATAVVGFIAVVGLSWSSWKRHILHQTSAASAGGTPENYVGQQIVAARAVLARTRLGLLFFWPFVLIGLLFGQSIREDGDLRGFVDQLVERVTDVPTGPILTITLLLLYGMIIRSHRRLQAELVQLNLLQQDYRAEQAGESGRDNP